MCCHNITSKGQGNVKENDDKDYSRREFDITIEGSKTYDRTENEILQKGRLRTFST